MKFRWTIRVWNRNLRATSFYPRNGPTNLQNEVRIVKLKFKLKQAFMVIEENYGHQAQDLTRLESFAGTQIGVNERVHNTLGQFQEQLVAMKSQTANLVKDLNLDWRMQALAVDFPKLQLATRAGEVQTLSREMQSLKQYPLWHEMEKAILKINLLKTATQRQ